MTSLVMSYSVSNCSWVAHAVYMVVLCIQWLPICPGSIIMSADNSTTFTRVNSPAVQAACELLTKVSRVRLPTRYAHHPPAVCVLTGHVLPSSGCLTKPPRYVGLIRPHVQSRLFMCVGLQARLVCVIRDHLTVFDVRPFIGSPE